MTEIDYTAFDTLARKVRNWGRWGDDDRRGTLNLVTPEALRRGGESVRQGKAFALGVPLTYDGPQPGPTASGKSLNVAFRPNPHLYVTALSTRMNASPRRFAFTEDVLLMPNHSVTHWDGLAHVEYDGMLYNGRPVEECVSVRGARDHGVEHLASPGITSHAVLLDIPRLRGVDVLDPEDTITPDDLERAEERQGVRVTSGDVVLVRTGHITHFTERGDREAWKAPQAGLDWPCAEWFHERGVAAAAADNLAVEPLPSRNFDPFGLPLHMLCLRDMGLVFGENFDLEALAADCDQDGQFDFLLSAPMLKIIGGSGSSVNPLVLK